MAITKAKLLPVFGSMWCPIAFSLMVDDFGIKYIRKEFTGHLFAVLKQEYELDEDWDGTKYCGILLD